MPQAITAQDVRNILENHPGLSFPSDLTDSILEDQIQEETAVALTKAGLTSLPSSGTVRRDVINGAVKKRVCIWTIRWMQPSDEELQDAMNTLDKIISTDLDLLETSSPESGFLFRVSGGGSQQ